MVLTTVNRLSEDATNAINRLMREDGIDWFQLEKHNGKIGMFDVDEELHLTLRDGLIEVVSLLDYDIGEYGFTDAEWNAFESLCKILHVDIS
jgi:hypothetical protein